MNLEPENLANAQQQLDEIFMKAAKALVEEQISQESFRTFNEAYKTVREVLERNLQSDRNTSKSQIYPP
ncbi:hypothetical protein [Scytonema sp. NUACC26]|uniref:hypothetical protein n=1 Tax=Scytonema sp. NUACC26 TaxID=3140176 RepID=UPI0034DC28AE